MNWTPRPTRRWLLILPLLMSTPLIWSSDTEPTQTQKPPPSMISIDACTSTCRVELEKEREQCNARSSQSQMSTIFSETCESDCSAELDSIKTELEAQCDGAVDRAIAHERRHYEPDMAAMTAERDRWRKAAEDALHASGIWRDLALGAGVVAIGAIVLAVL